MKVLRSGAEKMIKIAPKRKNIFLEVKKLKDEMIFRKYSAKIKRLKQPMILCISVMI
jgi:hypothetical protein